MTETIREYTGKLVVQRCWCGIQHAVPESLVNLQQAQHENGEKQQPIYCPLGHAWYLKEPGRAAKLEDALNAERKCMAVLGSDLEDSRRSRAALKSVITRMRRKKENETADERG